MGVGLQINNGSSIIVDQDYYNLIYREKISLAGLTYKKALNSANVYVNWMPSSNIFYIDISKILDTYSNCCFMVGIPKVTTTLSAYVVRSQKRLVLINSNDTNREPLADYIYCFSIGSTVESDSKIELRVYKDNGEIVFDSEQKYLRILKKLTRTDTTLTLDEQQSYAFMVGAVAITTSYEDDERDAGQYMIHQEAYLQGVYIKYETNKWLVGLNPAIDRWSGSAEGYSVTFRDSMAQNFVGVFSYIAKYIAKPGYADKLIIDVTNY